MARADTEKAKEKPTPKPKSKLSNKERHKRFVDMAHEVEASDDPKAFDEAFKSIVRQSEKLSQQTKKT